MRKLASRLIIFPWLLVVLVSLGCSSTSESAPESAMDSGVDRQLDQHFGQTEEQKNSWYNQPVLRSVFGDFTEHPDHVVIQEPKTLEELRERGRYLAVNVAACGSCHGAKAGDPNSTLSGGRLMQDGFGEVYAPNITPDSDTGIGKWSIEDVSRALRASIDRYGRPLSIDLHYGFRWMSDRDANAIAVYLLSQKPIKNEVVRRELGGFERNRWGIIPQHQEFAGYVPDLPKTVNQYYGRYLTQQVARCQTCHTADGGRYGATPFAGASGAASGQSIVGSFKLLFSSLGKLFSEDKLDAQSQKLLSKDSLQSEPSGDGGAGSNLAKDPDAAKRDSLLETGQFPILGPDIRGSSGLGEWSIENIVRYLNTGNSISGRQTDGRYCPWPFYRGMTEREKKAIALYLKSL